MKGKKCEGSMSGVRVDNPTPPHTNGSRVMAAAKKRKRGGAVKSDVMKVEGDMPKARMDRPKRASGGSVAMEKKEGAKEAIAKDIKADTKSLHAAEKGLPHRMRGGKVGADTKPFSHARSETPAKGHSTSGDL